MLLMYILSKEPGFYGYSAQNIWRMKLGSIVKMNEKEYKSALSKALSLLQHNDRTTYEIKKKLIEKGYSEEAVDSVVNYLISDKMLDDERYVKYYIVCYNDKRSTRRIVNELRAKGIDDLLIEECMEECSDETAIKKAFSKQLVKRNIINDDIITVNDRNKISAALFRQGFSIGDISKLFKEECD